jgi:hypothetical protein
MRKFLLVGLLVLAACGTVPAPKTPAQALIEAYAGLGSAVAAFNVYAGQRPFCGDDGAKPAPLCADRGIVIEGDAAAHQVADALDRAREVIRAVDVDNVQWQALAEPMTLLAGFRAFVNRTTGK